MLTPSRRVDSDINFVIMDYLINEGYPSAAKNFAMEANIAPIGDTESIQERVEIRNAIHSGDIQTAIEKINDLNPQVSFILASATSVPCRLHMIIFEFMHHSYSPPGVDEKLLNTSVLSMTQSSRILPWIHLVLTSLQPSNHPS